MFATHLFVSGVTCVRNILGKEMVDIEPDIDRQILKTSPCSTEYDCKWYWYSHTHLDENRRHQAAHQEIRHNQRPSVYLPTASSAEKNKQPDWGSCIRALVRVLSVWCVLFVIVSVESTMCTVDGTTSRLPLIAHICRAGATRIPTHGNSCNIYSPLRG